MKAYIFRKLETTEEVSSHGDKHSVTNWERILVTRTGAVSVYTQPANETYAKKDLTWTRPIWRSESGELFIQEQTEMGSNSYLAGNGEILWSAPWLTPCRIDGRLIPRYSYDEWYYSEPTV